MSKRHDLFGVFKVVGLALLLGESITACGTSNDKWKEEVQLSDGRIIVVERDLIRAAGGDEWASNRSGSRPKEYRIRFADPDGSGKWIEWRSAKISPQTWPEIPLVFDMGSAQPVVFSLVAISNGCEVYSKYVYKNGSWGEETLPERFKQRATNLLFASKKDLPELLDLAGKYKRNDAIGHRKALKQIGPNRKVCGD